MSRTLSYDIYTDKGEYIKTDYYAVNDITLDTPELAYEYFKSLNIYPVNFDIIESV